MKEASSVAFQLQKQGIQEKGTQLFPCLLSHIKIINSKGMLKVAFKNLFPFNTTQKKWLFLDSYHFSAEISLFYIEFIELFINNRS